jgi:uncharacterized protein (TIGR02391 family)
MGSVPMFQEELIEPIARLIGDFTTGDSIDKMLTYFKLGDDSKQSTKWRRLDYIFKELQKNDKCANRIIEIISSLLAPARFVGKNEYFENVRSQLNNILAFSGLEYGKDGKFYRREIANTLDEAESRLQTMNAKLKGRLIHSEVSKYCKKELLQDNYFHAVFEAVKGLAQRIRDMSGVNEDGATLIDCVFSIGSPLLAFNSLRTKSEKSEFIGFATLLKGCFMAIRNPLAHEPKLFWKGEDDAVDYLTFISLLHRKLDECVPTRISSITPI